MTHRLPKPKTSISAAVWAMCAAPATASARAAAPRGGCRSAGGRTRSLPRSWPRPAPTDAAAGPDAAAAHRPSRPRRPRSGIGAQSAARSTARCQALSSCASANVFSAISTWRAARVGVTDAGAQLRVVEIQAGEVARVGGVLQPQVDGVGAGIHRDLQCAQRARRAHQLRRSALARASATTAGAAAAATSADAAGHPGGHA